MITFISGVPGSGKTLYCIAKLLREIVGAKIKAKDTHGNDIEIQRTIYTNIKGLLIEHEFIDGERLNTWHEWCKPGDVICFDEVQEFWPPRPNGSKVPPHIQQLETHRHKGVDFILISQHPLLVDRNVLQLGGRHLHVRRFAGLGAAIVYEWDHVSRSLLFKNSMTKAPFRYDKNVFKLYKSAELHTKQKIKLPGLVWFVLAGLIGAAYFFPTTYNNVFAKKAPPPVVAAAPGAKPHAGAIPGPVAAQTDLVGPPVPAGFQKPSEPVFAGCAAMRNLCRCYDATGRMFEKNADWCETETRQVLLTPQPAPAALESSGVVSRGHDAADHDLGIFMSRMTGRYGKPLIY